MIYMITKNIDDIKIGLVLSGGGAKGAYEAGVFKAIEDLNISQNVSVISGTSIGTVNGLMFSMDDSSILKSSWASVNYSRFILNEDRVRNKNITNSIKRIYTGEKAKIETLLARQGDIGLLSQSGIKQFIEEYINLNIIKKCSRTIYACAYNIGLERPEYFKLNDYSNDEAIDIILASCAIPFIFKPIQINGYKYADGGINNPKYANKNADNVPIKPVINHNCDLIIVIYLSHRDKINKKYFENNNIVEIYPSAHLETIQGIGTINLNQSTLSERIDLGYRDGLVALSPIVVALLKGKSIEKLIERHNDSNTILLNKFRMFN